MARLNSAGKKASILQLENASAGQQIQPSLKGLHGPFGSRHAAESLVEREAQRVFWISRDISGTFVRSPGRSVEGGGPASACETSDRSNPAVPLDLEGVSSPFENRYSPFLDAVSLLALSLQVRLRIRHRNGVT